MKILVFQRADPLKRADLRFRHIPPGFETELVRLDAWEQPHLDKMLPRHALNSYDRVVLDLKEHPADVERIVAHGQRLMEARYTGQERDRRLYEALRDPLAPNARVNKRPYVLPWMRSLPARLVARAGELVRGAAR